MSEAKREKIYLGDSVYAERVRGSNDVQLTVENGVQTTQEIYLEEQVLQKLFQFAIFKTVEGEKV